jgi:hypothetical protein
MSDVSISELFLSQIVKISLFAKRKSVKGSIFILGHTFCQSNLSGVNHIKEIRPKVIGLFNLDWKILKDFHHKIL